MAGGQRIDRRVHPLEPSADSRRADLLAAAWTSFMFLYIYVDYYHLHKPDVIDNIQAGLVFEFPITLVAKSATTRRAGRAPSASD